ncbi:MAG: sugar ABC transporter substrate-binding protein, partial [Crenarchaeota archaeon]|nr:sugar ABC transporter substrate-binding protein [Thermoproteota archaeon]
YISVGGPGPSAKPFAGVSLSVVHCSCSQIEVLQKELPEFEEDTGMKVTIETPAWAGMREKMILDFTAHTAYYDVVNYDCVWRAEWIENGWLWPLDDYIARDAAEVNITDFPPAFLAHSSRWKGKYYGFPIMSHLGIFMYRTDLAAQYAPGITPPDTMDELVEFIHKLTVDTNGDGKIDVYGAGQLAGKTPGLIYDWANFLWGYGGDFFDSKLNPIWNSDIGVHALEVYKDLVLNYGHPDERSWSTQDELNTAFTHGLVATCSRENFVLTTLLDPKNNPNHYADVGWALTPGKTAKGEHPAFIGSMNIGINADSKKKEAAWEFIKWATSREIHKKFVLGGGTGTTSRYSVMRDPELLAMQPYLALQPAGMENPKPRPSLPEWPKIEEYLMDSISSCLSGERTAKQALDYAATEARIILQEAGYYTTRAAEAARIQAEEV